MFTPEPSLPGAPTASIPESEPAEFEFVLGRRQVASVSLVVLTLLVLFSSAAYMVGKSTIPAPVQHAQPDPIRIAPSSAKSEPEVPAPATAVLPDAPVFDIPGKDQRYIQLGSVERGFAIMMVHGARKLGHPAFVAAGTNPNVFRVLVGPFRNQTEYQTAKALFTSMGLEPFSRKYGEAQEPSETPTP
jgi:cell division septation protein DedD